MHFPRTLRLFALRGWAENLIVSGGGAPKEMKYKEKLDFFLKILISLFFDININEDLKIEPILSLIFPVCYIYF